MFVLAHLSDPHLGPLPRPRLAELASKRLLGFVNWHLRRHACHRPDVLDALIADVSAAAPDHIAITGDLINIALEEEFGPARAWLDRVGAPDRVSFVPGNHDIYVRATYNETSVTMAWRIQHVDDSLEWNTRASVPMMSSTRLMTAEDCASCRISSTARRSRMP